MSGLESGCQNQFQGISKKKLIDMAKAECYKPAEAAYHILG
jgi:hypothetical protein